MAQMSTAREFFRKESDEYVSGMRALLETPSPDMSEMRRLVRALRGSAQMAREDHVYRAARVLEAATRDLEEGRLIWDQQARRHFDATLDDLWSLVEIGEADASEAVAIDRIARVRRRWEELGVRGRAANVSTDGAETLRDAAEGVSPALREYTAREVGGILETVETAIRDLRDAPGDREPLKRILARQRALMGAAGLEAVPAVRDPLQVMDEVAREAAAQARSVEGPWLDILELGRDALREAAGPLASGELPPTLTPTLSRLRAVRLSLDEGRVPKGPEGEPEDEIPVEVVNFFRTESRTRLDKLGRMAEEMGRRREAEPGLRRELKEALTSLSQTAATFGFAVVSREIERVTTRLPEVPTDGVKALLGTLERAIEVALTHEASAAAFPLEVPARAASPVPPKTRPLGKAGPRETKRADVAQAPPGPEEPTLPFVALEELAYDREAALGRALELRRDLERAIAEGRRTTDLLDEIFDLIRLGIS